MSKHHHPCLRDVDNCVSKPPRFNAQNKDLRFGSFVFGPVVARLLHHFKKADLALQMFKEEVHQ